MIYILYIILISCFVAKHKKKLANARLDVWALPIHPTLGADTGSCLEVIQKAGAVLLVRALAAGKRYVYKLTRCRWNPMSKWKKNVCWLRSKAFVPILDDFRKLYVSFFIELNFFCLGNM